MRCKFKPWALPFLKENPLLASENIDYNDDFYNKEIEIEVGGGKGDFIIGISKLNPSINYLMIERVDSVSAVALKKIIANEIKNVKIIYNNFAIISKDIKSESINKIYLNFSDPWPKKRHYKRRLTSQDFLNEYHRILKKDGLIIFKTDQEPLYQFTKDSYNKKQFLLIKDYNPYITLEDNDVMTEYEKKFRSENKTIYRLIFKKV